jgi:hypothetical protein
LQDAYVSGVRQITQSELRVPTGYETVASLTGTLDEFAAVGVTFAVALDDDGKQFIEAGPIWEALIETATGEQALLVCPDVGVSDPPFVDLRAPLATTADARTFALAVAAALGLAADRCTWIIPADEWRDWRERYASLGGHS